MEILEHFEKIISTIDVPVIFEIGTNDSYHTGLLNKILLDSKKKYSYHGFEPDPRLLSRCKTVFSQYEMAKFSNLAICEKKGEIVFHLSSGVETRPNHVKQHFSGSSSIHNPTGCLTAWPDMKLSDCTVKRTTIKDYCSENNVNHVDFIWMDTQGAELDIFRGCGEFSKNIRYIYTEYSPNLYEGSCGLKEICELLSEFDVIEDYGGDVLLKNRSM